MINLEKSKVLADLETQLGKLNQQYNVIVKQKVKDEIDKFGKEFKDFFETKGLQVTSFAEHNTTPQHTTFTTEIGRIKIQLISNHRENSLECFELKWNDEAYTTHGLVIYSKESQSLYGLDVVRNVDTDLNIKTTQANIERLSNLIKSGDTISFTYLVADENDLKNKKAMISLSEILKENFS